jgi:twitching motility protein PilT
MTWIQTCLRVAQERKAQEVLIQAQRPVQFRIGKDLVPLANSAAQSSQETRQLLSQILSDEEKKILFENLKISGVKTIGDVSFKFDFQIDFEGINGSLVLQSDASKAWNFPPMVLESICRQQGLSLIVGPRRSGKSAALVNLLNAAQGRKKVIAIYTDDEAQSLQSAQNVLFQFPIEQLRANGPMKSADLIVIDSQHAAYCETALALAEEGRSVVLTLPFWDLRMGLERMLDLLPGSEASRARRLASTLQMVLGLKLVAGIETTLQGVFEVLFVENEIQKALRQQDLAQIPIIIKTQAEKTGMRSVNHSLFQLLMKRKIELKTAFEASPEPEELDALLKKVGI